MQMRVSVLVICRQIIMNIWIICQPHTAQIYLLPLQSFYASARNKLPRSTSAVFKADKPSAKSSPSSSSSSSSSRKGSGAGTGCTSAAAAQPDSSDELSVTSTSSTSSSSDNDFQKAFSTNTIAARTRAARATMGAAKSGSSSTGSGGGSRLKRGDGSFVSTHAFTAQYEQLPMQNTHDPIEQWDEEGDLLVQGKCKARSRSGDGDGEEEAQLLG